MLPSNTRPLARRVLLSFMLTFITARLVSILMLLPQVPDIYLYIHDIHIHHLIYGICLGLTFDEFGMWLHLNGDYWQRASFDAIVVLAAALGLAGFAPPMRPWRPKLLVAVLLIFGLLIVGSFRLAARAEPRLQRWEQRARS